MAEDLAYDQEPDEVHYEDEDLWEIGPDDSMSQAPWADDDPAYCGGG